MLIGRSRSASLLVAALSLLLACGGDDAPTSPAAPPAAPRAARVEAITPLTFTATVGTEVTPPPRVRVLDSAGDPLASVSVTFTALDGTLGGDLPVLTDDAGTAAAPSWVLAETARPQMLKAEAGSSSLVFTAVAEPGPLASLVAVSVTHQVAAPGATLRWRLRVKAVDAYGNGKLGVEVTFSVLDGGGTIDPPSAITGLDGVATSGEWTLGPTSGLQRAVARAPQTELIFTAEACPDACPELLFVREGNIHRYDLGTGGVTQLTSDGRSRDPAWSPDGGRIAFARQGMGEQPPVDIYFMNADGSNVVRRTTGKPFHSPTWSPDGLSIAVAGDWWLCVYECSIYLMSAFSDEIFHFVAPMGADPAYSPDGEWIAYVSLSGDDGYHALYITNFYGRETFSVVPRHDGGIFHPTWSPDGERIAFSQCLRGTCGIYIVDGSGITEVTGTATATDPAWSPDGRHIVFTLWPERAIAIISATGGIPEVIIENAHSPAWRP